MHLMQTWLRCTIWPVAPRDIEAPEILAYLTFPENCERRSVDVSPQAETGLLRVRGAGWRKGESEETKPKDEGPHHLQSTSFPAQISGFLDFSTHHGGNAEHQARNNWGSLSSYSSRCAFC